MPTVAPTAAAARTVVSGSNTAAATKAQAVILPTPLAPTASRRRTRAGGLSLRRGDDGNTTSASDNSRAATVGPFMPTSGSAAGDADRPRRPSFPDPHATP